MTTTPAAVAAPPRLTALLPPLGPLAMAGWAFAVPYQLSAPAPVWIPQAAAGTGRLQVAFVMLLLFAVVAVPGAIVLGLRARRASRRTGTAGLVLTVLGFGAAAFSGAGYDATAVAAHRVLGGQVPQVERLLGELDGFAAPLLAGALFVPCMAAGAILMGIAFWRGGGTPRWAAIAMVAAFPVILAGGAVSTLANGCGWLLLATAFWRASRT
ncbi:hypothetical protein [Nonomuraea sp. NPDC050310]|uniref:hypothetical protein n=1 Tax=Nonomuraea sp. NPDC050310 TaxID=3154935 RepID=UPI003409DA2C